MRGGAGHHLLAEATVVLAPDLGEVARRRLGDEGKALLMGRPVNAGRVFEYRGAEIDAVADVHGIATALPVDGEAHPGRNGRPKGLAVGERVVQRKVVLEREVGDRQGRGPVFQIDLDRVIVYWLGPEEAPREGVDVEVEVMDLVSYVARRVGVNLTPEDVESSEQEGAVMDPVVDTHVLALHEAAIGGEEQVLGAR